MIRRRSRSGRNKGGRQERGETTDFSQRGSGKEEEKMEGKSAVTIRNVCRSKSKG